MHLYTLSRGIKENVDRAIRDLQAQYFVNNNQGKEILTQFQVCPVQLWEFKFAQEHLNTVLSTIRYRDNNDTGGMNQPMAALRMMLKLKKIPELDYSKIPGKPIFNHHIGWHHIGIKEDLINDKGTELL